MARLSSFREDVVYEHLFSNTGRKRKYTATLASMAKNQKGIVFSSVADL